MLFSTLDIVRNFEARDNARGKAYQQEGRVRDIRVQNQGAIIIALVQGAERLPYRVEIETKKKGAKLSIQSHCNCPVGYMCKHGAAAMYEAIAQETRKHERLRVPTQEGETRSGLTKRLEDWLGYFEKNPDQDETIKNQDRLIYVIDSIICDGVPAPAVSVATQHVMRDGSWGTPRQISLAQFQNMARYVDWVDEQDIAILRIVQSGLIPVFGAGGPLPEDPELVDLLMRRLIQTGRAFASGQEKAPLKLGEPIEGTLGWALKGEGQQTPTIRLNRHGALPLFSSSPWYLDPVTNEAGLVHIQEDLKTVLHFLSIGAVGEKEAVPLRERLGKAKKVVPAPYKIKTGKEKLAMPVGHLRLLHEQGAEAGAAILNFKYGNALVHPQDGNPTYHEVSKGEIVLHKRHQTAERGLLRELSNLGLVPQTDPVASAEALDTRGFVLAPDEKASPWYWQDFVRLHAPTLKEQGFELSIPANFQAEIIEPDNDEIEAAFSQNGAWWFSLDLGIAVGGQRLPLLPILVAMLKKIGGAEDIDRLTASGRIYAPLPDGRQIALPGERIRTILKTLVELFDEKALDDDGKLNVSIDLAAAFLKLQAITRKRWLGESQLRKLVEKLGDFEGIQKNAPPKGLKADLRPYQVDGYNWLHFLGAYGLSGILADDMGLGKTIQTLAYILSLKERKKLDGPCLIIMPTSLIANWQSEIAHFTPGLKVLTLHGKDRLGLFDDIPKADVVLSTYPLLPRDGEKLKELKWSLIILDEAQAIKNPAAKMTQAACALEAPIRLCLTGTPVENHLGEAWSLFTFLMPGLLGEHNRFTKIWRTPIEKGQDAERKEMLAKRLRPFVLRRLKTEVAKELPPKTEIIRRVTLAEDQRDLYEAVRHAMNDRVRDEIAAKGIGRSQIVILDALLKLRQTCCDPRLVKLEAARKVRASAKLEELMEMLPTLIEDGRRILLFSQFTSMLDLIKPEIEKAGIPFVELRGTTKDRATPIQRFQGGDVPLFLISLKAGGTGLNLTAADTVIHFDPWWNPSVENQATDRAHRIGQDKPVFVYKLIAEGTVEERILDLQEKKKGLADALFGDKPGAAARLSPEDLQWLMG